MSGRPARWIVQEALDLGQSIWLEMSTFLGDPEHIPPSSQIMQVHTKLRHQFATLGKNIIIEQHKAMIDLRAGFSQGLAEIDFTASVCSQIQIGRAHV